MLVKVEMEVGEFARGVSEPYLDSKLGQVNIDFVQGIVEKIDNSKKNVKIEKYAGLIPFHRISEFTFGGVMLINKEYDANRVIRENQEMTNKIRNSRKP
jgi:hypothetical protein